MKTKEKTNYNFVNILKFIFSILVIASHTKLTRNITNPYIKDIISLLISCAVPFFFLCMGYSLAEKINFYDCNEKQLKRFKYVLIGIIKKYLFWSAIYLPLALVEYFQTGNSFIYSFFSYLKGLFLKGEHYNSWMLWYLLSFIYVACFIYVCLKKKIRFNYVGIACILIGSLSIVLKYSNLYNVSFSSKLIKRIIDLIKLTLDNGRIFTGFIYIYLGIMFNNKRNNIILICIVLFVGVICSFCNNSVIDAIGIIMISTSLFLISVKTNLPACLNNMCEFLRDMSSTSYYIHMYVYTIYYYLVYKTPTYSIDCFVYTTLITCAVSIIYIENKKKISSKLS